MAETISRLLGGIFGYIFYPAIIIGVFIYIFASICNIIEKASGTKSSTRRSTAAILPVIGLVFLYALGGDEKETLRLLLNQMSTVLRFVFGAIIAVFVLEMGKLMLHFDNDIGPSVYILFLSFLGVSIIYCFMGGFFQVIQLILMGAVVAGGLHVIFRGP